jgi:hypothetical protein
MTHYHEPEDLEMIPELRKLASDEFKGFVALDSIVTSTLALKLFERE